ncbi:MULTISPECIES: hypothetical protein [Hallella]|uniref:Uncharacterized protein n=1 Tax=Hallella faecis TaxID=2841596 RepID=A0ABV1FMZ5_9BACT|nr:MULTISPECIES: hypothetical protein [Hallella]MBP6273208.1 hypothetical protein [Prevotella sp.]MBS7400566.1 hypothetical protein [Prevotella sp.]MBU0288901.1 hypothetical protein [Hallella faecis]MCI7433161.1 hypothetical protein [Prevotella sp.]MDD7145229.1 hypothetical protein [Hallella sp.]
MNIITRNFFRLLRSGALNEYEPMEPMSAFKWRRLDQMVHAQHVERAALKGIKNHQFDEMMNIPEDLANQTPDNSAHQEEPRLSNHYLNFRLSRIENAERHAIDTNVDALNVLKIIVGNVSSMLNHGTMLSGIIELGSYLRNKGDKVDFVKLDTWLGKLQLRRMAQLQGSMLMSVFNFEQDELPFVRHVEAAANKLVLRSVTHSASDTAEEWHFRQLSSGFVQNNSALLRRNLRRSLRYITYAPLETVSNFFNNFARSLQEIEE